MTGHVLGIDAGGTTTVAVIADPGGEILGEGRAGPANLDDVGVERMRAALEAATEAARADARYWDDLDAAFLGVAGVISEADRDAVMAVANGLALRVAVDHDCRVALAGGLSGREGIVLIAGTGSACYGRRADGRSWRAGGWGSLVGDEGSAYWLGVGALRAAVRSFDGRGPKSSLEAAVLRRLGLSNMEQLLRRVHVPRIERTEVAALAPLVVQAADHGDKLSQQLLQEAADALGECVHAVAARLDWTDHPVDVALVGGLLTAGPAIRALLERAVARLVPTANLRDAELSPAIGACLLARNYLASTTSEALGAPRADRGRMETTS